MAEPSLESIAEKLVAVHDDVIVIKARCGDCRAELRRHAAVLDGESGEPGLRTEVTMLRARDSVVTRALYALAGSIGTLIGGAGVAIAEAIARH